jgi:hypothetical protein
MRSGEGVRIIIDNVDQAAVEIFVDTNTGAVESGTINHVFTQGNTQKIALRFQVLASDIYDNNDWMRVNTLKVFSQMSSFPTPTYTAGEIGQDALEITTTGILSSDYSLITDPGLAFDVFMTLDDGYETMDSVLQRLAAFGDSSNNTYGWQVWDDDGANDGLPRVELKMRSVADYDYIANQYELQNFADEEVMDEVRNYILVSYTDTDDRIYWITPGDYATLTDATSVANYGRRDYVFSAGNCTAALAKEKGVRYLAYHKEPIHRLSFGLVGTLRRKDGISVPVSYLRAGDRVKLLDWNNGEIVFLGSVDYDDDTLSVRCVKDLPPDTMEAWLSKIAVDAKKQVANEVK